MPAKAQIVEGRKRCGSCKEWRSTDEFYKNPKTPTGLHSWCIACTLRIRGEARRNNPVPRETARSYAKRYREKNPQVYKASERRQALRRFNMTPEEYDEKWYEQEGLCAICRQGETATEKKTGAVRLLAVDHCHESGDHRGLLCSRCNTALGLMQDNPDRLRLAADYIERSRA